MAQALPALKSPPCNMTLLPGAFHQDPVMRVLAQSSSNMFQA
jgi:hypothetical protein